MANAASAERPQLAEHPLRLPGGDGAERPEPQRRAARQPGLPRELVGVVVLVLLGQLHPQRGDLGRRAAEALHAPVVARGRAGGQRAEPPEPAAAHASGVDARGVAGLCFGAACRARVQGTAAYAEENRI